MENIIKKPSGTEKELKENVISFRLTPSELIELEKAMANNGAKNKAQFIKFILFNQPFKVVKVDPTFLTYLTTLNSLQAEYKKIGNNYNQATKAVKTAFSDKKALAFLNQLEKATGDLIKVNNEIKKLTEELKWQWSQR